MAQRDRIWVLEMANPGIARDLYLENSNRQAGYVVIILGQWSAAPRP